MKFSLSAGFSMLFCTFVTVLFVNILNFNVAMQKMNDYHYATVHEIESSDFSPYVISQRQNNAQYSTYITEKSSKEDLRIYEVKTSTVLTIPIFGFSQSYTKTTIAR